MKKAGLTLMIVGAVLIGLQMLSMIGNARAGMQLELTGDLAFDIGFYIGYFFIGMQGLILLVIGIILRCRSARTVSTPLVDNHAIGHCPRCGAALLENGRFCGACGMPLGSSVPDREDG